MTPSRSKKSGDRAWLAHLGLLLGLLVSPGCHSTPEPPKVVFADKPAELSTSHLTGSESGEGRVSVGRPGFFSENDSALASAIESQTAQDRAKREARQRAQEAYEASRTVQTPAGNGRICDRCDGKGTIKCPGSGIPGGVDDIRQCPNCRGTDRIPCPGCAGKGYTLR
jgi:hypothetical protein